MLAWVVDEELALRDAGGAKGIGLDNVRTSFQEAAVYIADHRRLREREDVSVVQQVLLRILESFSTDVRLGHAVGANGGAHGAIDDGDPLLQGRLEWVFGGSSHSLIRLDSARLESNVRSSKYGNPW